ncbi:MAG: diguanylate cyclase [Gemmatimonadota bacterium]
MPFSSHTSPYDALAALEDAWTQVLTAPDRAAVVADQWATTDGSVPTFNSLFARVILAAARGRYQGRASAHADLVDVLRAVEGASFAHGDRTRLAALALGVRGMLLTIERKLTPALEALNTGLSSAPSLSGFDRHCLHVWRAITHMASAKPELAFRDFFAEYEFVRVNHPAALALLLLNVGAVLLHAGDWEGAESSLQQAIASEALVEVKGFGVVGRVNLAYCYLQTGRVERAREVVRVLLERDREFLLQTHPGDVLATVAEDLVETGFHDEADSYLQNLLDDARERRFHLGLATGTWSRGRLAYLRGDAPQAIAHWRRAALLLRRLPHLPHLWKTLLAISESYAVKGDWRRAWRWHRRFHRAHQQWSAASQPARFAYAREALELQLTREQAIRDPVTGLLNRRELLDRLEQLMRAAQGERAPLVVGMIDLDNLKPINDRFGHRTGDSAIVFAAERLRITLPPQAQIFRYGGDEYCALLPGCTREQAAHLFASYLDSLRAWRNPAATERRSLLTASVGLAALNGVTRAEALLDAADTALYRAKRKGGNCIA